MEGKSVILYLYDYQEYLNERDLFYPFDENVVGKRVYTFEELLATVNDHDYNMDETERKALIEKFWGETIHFNSNQKVLDFVSELQT
jgi:CDP-glycerol glycerophosphotransferase (TagB/SpsB family)